MNLWMEVEVVSMEVRGEAIQWEGFVISHAIKTQKHF